ncbi:MAG TPA: NAD(P)-dependent oxidoreductase [Acidimicrobiales bacterium]|nr:NAD(P)-dependent oxidoreductase [Acidimicrobiales bacterium]
MDVAVVGMGSMGRAVALRLLAQGHRVAVWNRTAGRDGEVVAAGGRSAASPADAAAGTAAVLLSLSDDAAVRAVVLGSDGRTAGLVPPDGGAAGATGGALGGAVLVDLSTVAPATSRAVAAAVPGGRALSAPIFGAPQAVRDGQAAYLIGGPKAAADALEPLWAALSDTHRWVGDDPGTATTLKVLGNYLLMTGIATLAEAVATGQAAELDPDVLHRFLATSPLVAPALGNRLDDVIGGDHRGWFAAVLGAKDLRLMEELAAGAGLDLPLAARARERYEALADRGQGDLDIAGIVELLR